MISGHLYVVAAPSGAGKTTLVKALVDSLQHITVSISHTTRTKRPNEVDGVNYHFVTTNQFEDMIKQHDFLEHATIFTNYYGTSQRWVEETLAKGLDVILEIDWQGHQQIKRLFPASISIFILPPSLEALKERLVSRNQDKPEIIEQRLADTKETVSHLSEFDYLVVNNTFDHALEDLKHIVIAHRLECKQQAMIHATLIENLTA